MVRQSLKRGLQLLFLALVILPLVNCGQKGPLYLPTPELPVKQKVTN